MQQLRGQYREDQALQGDRRRQRVEFVLRDGVHVDGDEHREDLGEFRGLREPANTIFCLSRAPSTSTTITFGSLFFA